MRTLVVLCACAWLLRAPSALAQASEGGVDAVDGHVVALYDGDVVIDLAKNGGATQGAVVELWRPLKLKHPITGEPLTDRFLIGRLRLTQVQATLSFARPDGKLQRPPQAGDVVILRNPKPPTLAAYPEEPVPAPKAAPPPPPPSTPSAPATASFPAPQPAPALADADAANVLQILEAVRGKGVRARIVAYERHVKERPKSRYAAVLWEEAQKLRALVALEAASEGEGPTLRSFKPPGEATARQPVTLVAEIEGAVGAVLHARAPTELSYTSVPMKLVGPEYYSGTLPAERTASPGVDYFVEGVTATGETVPLVGSAEKPERLSVVDAPRAAPPPRHGSVASIATDFANWNLGDDNDFMLQTEGYVGMRFTDKGLRAVRTGFGVYRGRGGSLEELDSQGLDGRDVGLTYGYLEGEYGISHFTGLVARVLVGLEKEGLTGGFLGFVRLGNDRETNLLFGAEVLGTIGLRGITQLELATFPRFPILLRTEVTNQPAGVVSSDTTPPTTSHEQGDVGGRAIAQLGYRVVPELTLAVRGSYQGRTINHAGPGFGGGVTYTW